MNRHTRRAAKGTTKSAGSGLVAQALLAKAVDALKRNDATAAMDAAQTVLAADPTSARAHFLLGSAWQLQKRLEDAVRSYRRATKLAPDLADAHNNLGTVLLTLGQIDDAVAAFRAAIAVKPAYPEAHCNLGNALNRQGQPAEAIAAYQKAIALRAGYAEAHYNLGNVRASVGETEAAAAALRAAIAARDNFPEAHFNLANVLTKLGRRDEAVAAFGCAIAHRTGYVEAYHNLGNLLVDLDRFEEAIQALRTAIELRPHWKTALSLATLLSRLERWDEAVTAYRQVQSLRPDDAEVWANLCFVLLQLGQLREAIEAGQRAVAIDPRLTHGHYILGNALRDNGNRDEAERAYRQAAELATDGTEALIALGNMLLLSPARHDEAQALFRQAHALKPLSKRPAITAKPDFSVLLLTAPGLANTPSDYLIRRSAYDSYFLMLLNGADYDVAQLRTQGDVIVNLVSDPDASQTMLTPAIDVVERLALPTINHPRAILTTGRDTVAARLSGISRCRVPRTVRATGAALASSHLPQILSEFALPVLVRVSGVHGGRLFEKFTDQAAIADFGAQNPEADHYVTEYVPYELADGHFRKYRFIFVDGEIFPYHLAIGDQWKVHHFRTDMANQEWMRAEEEAFVSDPWSVFGAEHREALRAIQTRIDLDYFGIDCAIDHRGDLLMFEANASMLVHGERSVFAYKESYVARIKQAFDAMLARRAKSARAS